MADVSSSIRYLLEALRTPSSEGGTTPRTGPEADMRRGPPAGLGPIEQRRDGYRLYMQDKRANGEDPLSYQEWIRQEQ